MDDHTVLPQSPPLAPATTPLRSDRRAGAASLIVLGRGLATPALLLALLLLPVLFFWRVAILHNILLPWDILSAHDPLWQPLPPRSIPIPANPLDSDALTEFYPWTALAASSLRQGILPLWNPYAFSGTPFLAAMQTAVLYPVNLLLDVLFAPGDILGARAIAHLAIALTGTFLFARRLAISRPGSVLAALAFGLGLPYVVWLEHPMSGAIAWLPWLLLCIDGTLATQGRRWPLATAAAVAVEILAGHGESTMHILLLCGAYALVRAWRPAHIPTLPPASATAPPPRPGTGRGTPDRRPRSESPLATGRGVRGLVALALAATLGCAMAFAHLLPAVAQIPLSEAAADRSAAASAVPPLGDPSVWTSLLTAIVPDFFGSPTWQTSAPAPAPALSYNEMTLYIGAVPLFLAILAIVRGRHAYSLFFAGAALVALGAAVRLPVLGMVNDLPLLRVASNGRLRVDYAFAMAVLAGYGHDLLTHEGSSQVTWRVIRLWATGGSVLALAGVVFLLTARPGGAAPGMPIALHAAVPIIWMALTVVLVWLHRRGVAGALSLRVAMVVLVMIDLFSLGVGYHATTPRGRVTSTPAAIRRVQGDHSLFRVAGLDRTLYPSLSSLYGLQDIRGYDPAYDADYERYFFLVFGQRGMRLKLGLGDPIPVAARALDLLNVKYLFAPCYVQLNPRIYRPIFRGAGCVYRNERALPRAFVVHRVLWTTPARATALVGKGAVDARTTALLDPATARRGIPATAAVSPGAAHRDSVGVTYDGLNRVDLTARLATAGVLVLGDAYAPGWQATIDGQDAPLMRADAILRAIMVGKGRHHISFIYAPATFTAGTIVSGAALTLWLSLLIMTLWQNRTRPAHSS